MLRKLNGILLGRKDPLSPQKMQFDCCLVLICLQALYSFPCKVPQKVYCGGEDDRGREAIHFAHNKSIQKNSLSLQIKWEQLLPLLTVSWLAATELGIQKSLLKAPTSTWSHSKTQMEELHSSLPTVCLGKLAGEGNTC